MRRWLNWDLACTRASFSESTTWFLRFFRPFQDASFKRWRAAFAQRWMICGEKVTTADVRLNLFFFFFFSLKEQIGRGALTRVFGYCDVWFRLCVHVYSPLWFQCSSENTQKIHVDEAVCVRKRGERQWVGCGSGLMDRMRRHHGKKKENYSIIDIKCCIAVTSIYIVYVYVLLSL